MYLLYLYNSFQNAVTHKKHDAAEDKRSMVFTWTPPAGLNDDIKFR